MTEAQEIERLRNELRMQKARIRHWIEDVRHNLNPTLDSLFDASEEIDFALKGMREATHA